MACGEPRLRMTEVCAFVLSGMCKPVVLTWMAIMHKTYNNKAMKKVFLPMLLFAAMFAFTACGDDDEPDKPKLLKNSYSIYHEDIQIIEGTNLSDVVWESENEFVATVSNGVITGQYVGKTEVRSAEKLSFSVEVKPKYYTYEEPSMEWGASKASIKSKYGTPKSEITDALLYQTSNSNVPFMMFVFENDKLTSSAVVANLTIATRLVDFLTERYVVVAVDVDNYSATLTHCYGKRSDPQIDYLVGMEYSSSISGILVVYLPYTESRAIPEKYIDESVFEEFEAVLMNSK